MTATPPLVQAVLQAEQDMRVQLAMIFGAQEEGGLYGPWGTTPSGPAVGDYGHSYGPYQINLPYHPGVTPEQAANPTFAVGYMRRAYEKAVASIPDSLWRTNPELATEEAAVAAERPAQPYIDSHGQAQVDQAYERAMKLLGNSSGASSNGPSISSGVYQQGTARVTDASLTGGVGKVLGGTALDFLNPLAGVFGAGDLKDLVERGALIILGALLMIVGLIMLVKDTSAGKEAVGGAKDAVAAAGVAAVAA